MSEAADVVIAPIVRRAEQQRDAAKAQLQAEVDRFNELQEQLQACRMTILDLQGQLKALDALLAPPSPNGSDPTKA